MGKIMSIVESIKGAVQTLQLVAAAATALKVIAKEIYQVFNPSEKSESSQDELVSHSFSSTEIAEEVMIFKDENGEMKTVISRKVKTKNSSPDNVEIANDNIDQNENDKQTLQIKDPSAHIRKLAESICANNNSEQCKHLLGEINSDPPDSEAAA